MRSSCRDFIVGCCAEAGWVGYGRGLELLYEFLDYQQSLSYSNAKLLAFFQSKLEGVDVGELSERMHAQELVRIYGVAADWSDETELSFLCEYIDESEEDLQQALMGFFNDMVASVAETYDNDQREFDDQQEFEDEEDW